MHETHKQSEPMTGVCPSCGAVLHGRAVYCPSCGVLLSGTTGRLQAGRMLAGRYGIVRLIARGGMGAVYLAEDSRLASVPVAVKEMATSFMPGDTDAFAQAVADFQREAAMLARLRHPHLPHVSDQFAEEGKQYLVMEYIEGQTLREQIQQAGGRLPLDQALDYADQLCDVLAYLHAQEPPIIYRDLKPANVMVVPAWNARQRAEETAAGAATAPPRTAQLVLIDFGIARFYRPGRASDTAVYGTIGYAPTEQYGRGQTDARTDIYALGVVLHQMLTGHDPTQTPFALPPPRSLDPAIPPHIVAAIERATANDRAARFTDITAFRSALRSAVAVPSGDRVVKRPADTVQNASGTTAGAGRAGLPIWSIMGIVGVVLVVALFGAASLAGWIGRAQPQPTAAPPTVATSPAIAAPSAVIPAIDSGGDGATPQAPGLAPVLLRPSGVSASGQAPDNTDSLNNTISYGPENAVDGRPDTTWRVPGDGTGQWLQLDFPSEVGVRAVGIIPGYDKIDPNPNDRTDRFAQNRVVKLVRLEFSDGTTIRASFTQQRDMQFVPLDSIRTRWIRIVIEQTYPPQLAQNPRDFTPISEVQVQGTP